MKNMENEYQITALKDRFAVESIRELWTAWQNHPNSDIDYYLSRFELRSEFKRPHILLASKEGKPQAILVGRLDESRIRDFKVGPFRPVKPRARVLSFIYAGLLGSPTLRSSECMVREVETSLARGEADLAVFNNVSTESSLFAALKGARGNSEPNNPILFSHYSMQLGVSLDEVVSKLSKNHRAEIRKRERKIFADFTDQIRIDQFRGTERLELFMRDAEMVAKKTYQRSLGVGFQDTPEMRMRLSLFAMKDCFRGYILYVKDQPAAFWLGTLYRGTFQSEMLGYDPALADYSLGTFIFMNMLSDFCRDRVSEIDFGFGVERYKERFGNRSWNECLVWLFAPTFAGKKLKFIHGQAVRADRLARSFLEKTGIYTTIKKRWRKHLSHG
jgi:Acetyltransferase (GNAT) domain